MPEPPYWHAANRPGTYNREAEDTRHVLADAARAADWSRVLAVLNADKCRMLDVNGTRIGDVQGSRCSKEALVPDLQYHFEPKSLAALESGFHEVVLGRVSWEIV